MAKEMQLIKDIHKSEFGVDPLFVVRVPGVIRFFGLFAEIYGGSFISGTDDKSLHIAITPRDDQVCNFYNATNNERKRFLINGIKYKAEDNIVNYVKAVIKSFSYLDFKGFDITVEGDYLNCEDCCVSSALSIGMTAVFNKMYNLNLSSMQLVTKAYQSVKMFCNKNACLSDLITMANGGKENLVSYNFKTGKLISLEKNYDTNNYSVLLLTVELEKDVAKNTLNDLFEAYTDIQKSALGEVSLRNRFELANLLRVIPSELHEYAKFIAQEDKCTEGAVDAYKHGRFGIADKFLTKLYTNMTDHLDLFFPEYDWIVKRAVEMGECSGVGMAFSGLNPVVVARIKKQAIEKFITKMSEYNHFFGTEIKILPYQPSEGIEFITESDNENTSCK